MCKKLHMWETVSSCFIPLFPIMLQSEFYGFIYDISFQAIKYVMLVFQHSESTINEVSNWSSYYNLSNNVPWLHYKYDFMKNLFFLSKMILYFFHLYTAKRLQILYLLYLHIYFYFFDFTLHFYEYSFNSMCVLCF